MFTRKVVANEGNHSLLNQGKREFVDGDGHLHKPNSISNFTSSRRARHIHTFPPT